MSNHKYEVGDVLQMCHDTLDKVWVLYLSQSVGNKMRARVLGSDDEYRIGKTFWYDPMHVDNAEKVGYNKYIPYTDYKEGDVVKIVGKCCEAAYWEDKHVTYVKLQHYPEHSYNHKVYLRDHKGAIVTVCVHCIRPNQPQPNLL